MAKPKQGRESDEKKGSPPEAAAWGTWEELLLAYAVNRLGTNNWDSISSELQKRSSAPIIFTPKHCKQKYQELERRFGRSNGNGDDVDIGDDSDTITAAAVPWIEELRELRVAELQRELQNFDTYISSLQLKVKKLTEESEKNGCGDRKKKPDLGQKIDENEIKNEEEADNKPLDLVVSGEEQVPGVDESDRDNQSMNGSNGNLETGAEMSENESSPLGPADEKLGSSPHSLIGVEDSWTGRPEDNEPVKSEPVGGASQAPESKSEGTIKENSDVQSSARKERSDRVRRGCSKTDERENEDQSKNHIPIRSWPLIDILQKVHKVGSAVFEPRLDRQEKLRYKKLIREHIDLKMLQTRLKEGWYSDGNNRFFRDLLLLVNNACIFFSNESPETIDAIKLRQFIAEEMASKRNQKTNSKSTVKKSSPKRSPEPPNPMLLKPMIACRKHSTISKKNVSEAEAPEKTSASESSGVKSDIKNNKNKKSEEKKRGASKFLNRMNNAAAVGSGSDDDIEAGQKRCGGDSLAKKSVGRPSKKVVARSAGVMAAPPRGAALGKRNRESEGLVSTQAKKRSKRG